jgi:predicted lactoylglutathione lyase
VTFKPTKLWQQDSGFNITTKDMRASENFYSHLGFQMVTQAADTGNVVQFTIDQTDSRLNLIAEEEMQKKGDPQDGTITAVKTVFILDCDDMEEVDEYSRKSIEGRGSVITPPHVIQGGYECDFADPDGHHWKVLFRKRKQPLIKSFFDGQDTQAHSNKKSGK